MALLRVRRRGLVLRRAHHPGLVLLRARRRGLVLRVACLRVLERLRAHRPGLVLLRGLLRRNPVVPEQVTVIPLLLT